MVFSSVSFARQVLPIAVRSTRCFSTAKLAAPVQKFIDEKAKDTTPSNILVLDGSDAEMKQLTDTLLKDGVFKKLSKYPNSYLAKSDPKDVARVEKNTVVATESERDTRPILAPGVDGQLNTWISLDQFKKEYKDRFMGSMKGRTMYVIPFSMGPVGSPLAKIGIQLTDSPYVAACMCIMTRVGTKVLDVLGNNTDFIPAVHSVGRPLPSSVPLVNSWPCCPEKVLIGHIPDTREIISFGSGYGGNALLGKKCFALRIASCIARDEGWLAEHMLILGITNPQGVKKYFAAAFPSACGKTNMAMMKPATPGWKVECVGDDIAWMRFDKNGVLRAINPESGFFGVCPGTSAKSNPFAMKTFEQGNTVFTNVGETSDGGVYWEGMDVEIPPGVTVTSWTNKQWTPKSDFVAAHPNSRFCAPASQCPIIDPLWESSDGVPIEGIIFGGRRPEGIPLVYEAFNWQHGVFVGGAMRSEATTAAEHKAKSMMHDPFAMRPFFGYNFGQYMSHWLSFQNKPNLKLPKIFHVNWFRRDAAGNFIWPGFGDNARVVQWMFDRVQGKDVAVDSPIGLLPKEGTINVDGLKGLNINELFKLDKAFLTQEIKDLEKYFSEQVNQDMPAKVTEELNNLKTRVSQM